MLTQDAKARGIHKSCKGKKADKAKKEYKAVIEKAQKEAENK